MEQTEKYLDYKKSEEESTIERLLDKKIEHHFSKIFDDLRHQRSLILLKSLPYLDILKQSNFTDGEKKYFKESCS